MIRDHNGVGDVPGGSVGDPRMAPIQRFAAVKELKSAFENEFGYDAAHNKFFKRYLVDKRVADFGCGHGLSTFYVADVAKEVIGYDIDSNAVNYALELKRRWAVHNVDFRFLRSNLTGAADYKYDVILSSDVLEHVARPDLYLSEAHRICALDGLLLLSTPNGQVTHGDPRLIRRNSPFHFMEYTPIELEAMLEHAGFTILESFAQKRLRKTGNIALRDALAASRVNEVIMTHNVLQRVWKFYRRVSLRISAHSIEDFRIEPEDVSSMTAANCETILVVCMRRA